MRSLKALGWSACYLFIFGRFERNNRGVLSESGEVRVIQWESSLTTKAVEGDCCERSDGSVLLDLGDEFTFAPFEEHHRDTNC